MKDLHEWQTEVADEIQDLLTELTDVQMTDLDFSEDDDYRDGYWMQEDETAYAEILKAKRPVTSQYLAPSRLSKDSEMANGSASVNERTQEQMLNQLRREASNLTFTQKRATGYADVRSSGDLVEDATEKNIDQAAVQGQGFVKPTKRGGTGRNGHGLVGGATFAKDVVTEEMEEDNAYNAAARKLKEAQSGSDLKMLIAELHSDYPELMNLDRKLTQHPAMKLGRMLAAEMDKGRLRQGTSKKKNAPNNPT